MDLFTNCNRLIKWDITGRDAIAFITICTEDTTDRAVYCWSFTLTVPCLLSSGCYAKSPYAYTRKLFEYLPLFEHKTRDVDFSI